jgi:integrase
MASIKKLPSGNFRALIRMSGFETQSETFKKSNDAKVWAKNTEDKLKAMRRSGKAMPPKGSTFADFIDKYIEETDPVKPHGKNKKACLERLKKDFSDVLMIDMTEYRISEYVSKRSKSRNYKGEIISGVTISVDLSYISTVLGWAKHVKNYDVDDFAAKKVRASLSKRGFKTKSEERDREATAQELEKIMKAYEKKGARQLIPMWDLIRFAIHSAMRQEEICNIKIEDIDFNENTVIIRDRKDPQNKKGNDQVIPIFDEGWSLVIKYAGDRKKGRVFPYNHSSVSASFTRICKECEIENLHFHDLRHTAIGILFSLGLQIQEVAIVSGHKDWKMLKRYTHIKAKDVQAIHREKTATRKRRDAVIDFLSDDS